MLEKLASTKVSLQKVEGTRRLRGALGPLLCAVAFGSWLDAGAAYALDVPPDAALQEDAELLPITLNPPGDGLVFKADEPCVSTAPTAPADAAANVQMDKAKSKRGNQGEPEEKPLLEATSRGACVPLASFAAAGEPVFAAHAAGSSFGFSATLGQLMMFAGVPAAIAEGAKKMADHKGKHGGPKTSPPHGNGMHGGGKMGGPGGAGGGPGGAGGPGGGNTPPTPTPEPASTLLFLAGAALVGRAAQRRAGR